MASEEKDYNALISLLDDPDEEIYSHIREKLVSYGEEVIPFLEKEWENSFDGLIQKRIENIIHNIQFENIGQQLHEWASLGGGNLLRGAMLVAKYQYPDLDEEAVISKIELLKQDAWLEVNPRLTALEKVKVLNHIIFDVHGFSGNTSNFHAPQNSYINNVLESKKGNPLSLSLLYTVVAQGLDIPIYGVNLPEHFILAYVDEDIKLPLPYNFEDTKVIFYINPFSKGTIFSRNEVDAFLKQLKINPDRRFYEPCSNLDMIKRLINNLIFAYEKLGYPDKINELKALQQALITDRQF